MKTQLKVCIYIYVRAIVYIVLCFKHGLSFRCVSVTTRDGNLSSTLRDDNVNIIYILLLSNVINAFSTIIVGSANLLHNFMPRGVK